MSSKLIREYVKAVLSEGPRGLGMRAVTGAPWKPNRHSLGWGTGLGGGNMASTRANPGATGMGGYPNAHGGSTVKSNPVMPYSDEFSEDNDMKRQVEFDARAQEFMGSVDALKRALSLARTSGDFDDALATFFGSSGITIEDVMDGSGRFDSLMRNGETQKAHQELVGALDIWAKKRLSDASMNDNDGSMLDGFEKDSKSFKQTISGMHRWS